MSESDLEHSEFWIPNGQISDEDVRALYTNKQFPTSFTGLLTFANGLLLYANVKRSSAELRNILKPVDIYQIHVAKRDRGERRHYFVEGFGKLFQAYYKKK